MNKLFDYDSSDSSKFKARIVSDAYALHLNRFNAECLTSTIYSGTVYVRDIGVLHFKPCSIILDREGNSYILYFIYNNTDVLERPLFSGCIPAEYMKGYDDEFNIYDRIYDNCNNILSDILDRIVHNNLFRNIYREYTTRGIEPTIGVLDEVVHRLTISSCLLYNKE